MKKLIILLGLLIVGIVSAFSQTNKPSYLTGQKWMIPKTGVGVDSAIVYQMVNKNTLGLAGFMCVSGTDTAYFLLNGSAITQIYSSKGNASIELNRYGKDDINITSDAGAYNEGYLYIDSVSAQIGITASLPQQTRVYCSPLNITFMAGATTILTIDVTKVEFEKNGYFKNGATFEDSLVILDATKVDSTLIYDNGTTSIIKAIDNPLTISTLSNKTLKLESGSTAISIINASDQIDFENSAGSPFNVTNTAITIGGDYTEPFNTQVNDLRTDSLAVVDGTGADSILIYDNGTTAWINPENNLFIANVNQIQGKTAYGGQISFGVNNGDTMQIAENIILNNGTTGFIGNIYPYYNNLFDFGSSTKAWRNGYFSNSVGIGVSPITALTVGSTLTTSPRGIMSWQANTGTQGARMHMRKSRGTFAASTILTTGDTLGRILWSGCTANNTFTESASINVFSTGTVAATRMPSIMTFNVSTDAAPSVPTERMRIRNDGYVGIGATTGITSMLTVGNGGNITTNVPPQIYIRSYSTSGGIAQLLGEWPGTNNWAIGHADGTNSYLRIGLAQAGTGTTTAWNADQTPIKVFIGGGLSIGGVTTAMNYSLSFGGTVARTIGMERHTTAETAGNNLTISAGSCTSGANKKGGGMLVNAPGVSTSAAFSSVRTQRLTRYAIGVSATTDNTLLDAIITPSEKNLVDNTNDTLFSVSIVATQTDSIVAGNFVYDVLTTKTGEVQAESGNMNFCGVVKDGVATVSTPSGSVFVQSLSSGSLTGTWALTWNNTTKLFYMIVKYDSSLDPTAGTMKMYYNLHNGCRGAVTQF